MIGKAATTKLAQAPSTERTNDRSQWSFGRLLDWHLRRGTRPGGKTDHPGRQWGVKEFASAVGLGDRTIRYWLNDEHLPPEVETIEGILFGKDPCYDEWRLELRHAHARSQGGKGHEAAPASTGKMPPVSNNRVPTHFMGRDEALLDIEAALKRDQGRVAITALHGLRGVGKTTLAAAYADRHRGDYRATWWIRAQTELSMRADLVALGVRLGWVGAKDEEDPALAAVRERLRHERERILLIFDNAIDADAVRLYLPRGGAAEVLVTSNAHAWRGVAAPVEIRLWPKEVGADYLIVRTGREKERAAAEALSEALGGLPLALEQAAAYCERLHISIAEYRKRFETSPARFMDDARHAPAEYRDGMTVTKTFALAIEEAASQHPASEPFIVHAALLAPEPIPLFLFAEAREKFGEPLASALAGDGLDEIVATLRTFALIDRETIVDERDPTITTDTVRLHRLVRQVVAARRTGDAREHVRRTLVEVVAAVYPEDREIEDDPIETWPRARRLDPLAVALVGDDCDPTSGVEERAAKLLNGLARYRYNHFTLIAYAQARSFCERALRIREKVHGPEHPETALSLESLGDACLQQGDMAGAQSFYERALRIREKVLGPEHPDTAKSLESLGHACVARGDFTGAQSFYERALRIREKVLGPEHPDTAKNLDRLGYAFIERGDLAGAQSLYERALRIREKVLGPEHRDTAANIHAFGHLFQKQGDPARALSTHERALAIVEKVLGPEHLDTASSLYELACLRLDQGDLAGARPLLDRAPAILEKVLDPEHPSMHLVRHKLARAKGNAVEALTYAEAMLACCEKTLGEKDTKFAAQITADALDALGRAEEAAALRARYHIEPERPSAVGR
jgi:tetratricopeptide (TPR) repeat protein